MGFQSIKARAGSYAYKHKYYNNYVTGIVKFQPNHG